MHAKNKNLRQMNILFLSHVRDASGANGGMIYSNQILSQLKRICNRVDVLYVYDQPPKFRRMRMFFAVLRSIASRMPAKALYFDILSVHRSIKQQVKAVTPDALVFDHLETAVYLRDIPRKTISILIQHNDEAKLYDQRLSKMSNALTNALLKSESKKLRRFQDHTSRLIKNKVFISSDEMNADKSNAPDGNRISLLPTFDYEITGSRTLQSIDNQIHLAFLGNMKWWPNQDAVRWLLDNIAPQLQEKIVIHLMGQGSDAEQFRRENVIGHGFVACASDIWSKANIFLSPIVSGAGLNVKVAEALFNQKSIITTTQGIRGIPVKSDPAIVVSDDASEWVKILNNTALISRLNTSRPLEENSRLFDRDTSSARFKKFLQACK